LNLKLDKSQEIHTTREAKNISIFDDLAHMILPTKNQSNENRRLFRRPNISENVPKSGCVIVEAKRNEVPLQKAWLLEPPSSAVIAGRAAAIITASSADINAVRFNVKYATQNLLDLPPKGFLFFSGAAVS
jgi:hypothetical protein